MMIFRVKITLLISLVMFLYSSQVSSQSPLSSSAKEVNSHQWVKEHFARGKIPPFSFVYGGKSSESFIKSWTYRAEKKKTTDPNIEESVFTYSDKQSGLVVKCFVSCFNDFHAVEWVLKFINTSAANSPVIEKAAAINYSFVSEKKGTFVLHHAKGSNAERTDFQPVDENLKIGANVYMTPFGGRSSDNTAFPFFNIEAPGERGIVVAIGWTGKWYADISQLDAKTVLLKSGMEKLKVVLYSKEEIRTPKICLLFWKGEDRMEGHNQFRQFILAHNFRKINGKFAEYPLSGSFDYGDPAPCNEYNCLRADYAIALVYRYQQFKVAPEVFWLDAGWYTGCGWDKGDWWQNVGNWTPEKDRFPDGLKPVSDAVHAVGSKFMVWFEPERVRKGTQFEKEHPEWMLRIPGDENCLFDLGNTTARLWLTDYISDFLKKQGIDYYRQDFNFDPMPYWEGNDKPDRIGISEIRHIEGLYAYWDSLLVRFPNLLIDNCASGGRRLDLETTLRSAPLWRTDYQYGEPNGYQCHAYGLNFYLPIHGTSVYKTDNYFFRSGLGATMVMNWEVTGRNSESIPAMQKCIKNYKTLRPYFYSDYYPLTGTGNMTQDNVWLSYQLNRPAQSDGIIIAFRRKDCDEESLVVKLRGLDPKVNYELTDEDSNLAVLKTGEELIKGLTLIAKDKPGSLLIMYKMVPSH